VKKTIFLALAFILVLAVGVGAAVEVTLLGPKQYVRTDASPNLFSDSFPGKSGTGKIIVQNGGVDGADLVSGAIIRINGVEVFGVNDFNQKVTRLEKVIPLVATNVLSCELRSKPNSFLSIEISQDIPGEAGSVIGTHGGSLEVPDPSSPLFGTKSTRASSSALFIN